MSSTFRISPAHVEYLEHTQRRLLGSSTHEQIRDAVKKLLRGELRARPLPREYRQSGRAFVCYGLERMRVKFPLTVKEGKALCSAVSPRPGETTLEAVIREHAERAGYTVSHHICDRWCGPECPAKRVGEAITPPHSKNLLDAEPKRSPGLKKASKISHFFGKEKKA